ncbi:cell division protein ZapB [Ferrimonas marina]|uniref:Cell division protein ZapB n=1 Tax=Ferrimonas marina TaxID=299255 RepID=A0A1M5XSE9_9GAMM|nr:cell division protein ZapB [Ferrimonas marina]SHI02193.1 cell division protein ZapB [Ferrimonas marina]
MSLELLEKLESRVHNALETMELMQLELEEEKLLSAELAQERDNLHRENQELKQQLSAWHAKVEGLLGKLPDQAA